MDGIPLGAISNGIGVGALLVLLFLMLATGRLFTRGQHEEAIHDRDEWRAESRIKDAQIAEKDRQLQHMAEVGRTVRNIMRALHTRSDDEGAE